MGIDVTLISNIEKVAADIEKTAKSRMEAAVMEVRNEVLIILSGNRSGRIYKVPGTGVTYTASAPGEPPAQRLGELRQSIATEVEGIGKDIVGRVGTDKIQGKMTEFGTRNMAARPWLRPTFERMAGKVQEIFISQWF
ncbi:MAG: HK97 gp10 family phage protein [Ignavibacteria bacterium]|nr:HK97 gp10 family phage protein [Ignavibacteria bacterium]